MEEKIGFGYFIIIPTVLLNDNKVSPNAKLCFGVVSCLSNDRGYCFASNKYIAEMMNVHEMTISKYISELIANGYLIKFDEVVNSGLQRRLALSIPIQEQMGKQKDLGGSAKTLRGGKRKDLGGVSENAYHNNISSNNISLILKDNNKEDIEILNFNSDLANEAWMDWIRYRKEIGKKLSLTTKNAQIKFLKQFSDQEIAEIINNSIKNGWQGLFDLKKKKNGIDYDSELQSILGS